MPRCSQLHMLVSPVRASAYGRGPGGVGDRGGGRGGGVPPVGAAGQGACGTRPDGRQRARLPHRHGRYAGRATRLAGAAPRMCGPACACGVFETRAGGASHRGCAACTTRLAQPASVWPPWAPCGGRWQLMCTCACICVCVAPVRVPDHPLPGRTRPFDAKRHADAVAKLVTLLPTVPPGEARGRAHVP
jgi:hypothetical protein